MECDCILIEAHNGCGDVDEDVWRFASERIMSVAQKVENREGSIRYFIVGNRKNGYQGIERDMEEELETHPTGRWIWKYKTLDRSECNEVLRERWHY